MWKKPREGLSDRLVEGTVKFEGQQPLPSILKDKLLNSLKYYGCNPSYTIIQQDNDPKHTFKKVKKWLGNQDFRIMVWPAQSPDLNPI